MFVAVRTYDNYIPANMMLQRLEEEGIRAWLQDEHTVTIDPILANAVGGIKLMVYHEQVPRAMDILQHIEQAYKKSVTCPRCGSTNVHFVTQTSNPANWLSAIASWLFGNYAISVKQVYHCFDCEYEFGELPESENG